MGFGLVSLSAPRAFEVADVEALPVDIVPIESITQIQEGRQEGADGRKAGAEADQRPEPWPDAQKVGDNELDTDNPADAGPQAEAREDGGSAAPAPKPVEQAEAGRAPKPKDEPKPVPATEVAPVPQPKRGGQARAGQAGRKPEP
jgi:colicin import membrane protein